MLAIFKEIRGTRTKRILQIGTIRVQTHRSGWTVLTKWKAAYDWRFSLPMI